MVRWKIEGAEETLTSLLQATTSTLRLQGKVEQELERLEHAGIIKPIQFSDWAAPVVPVIKNDGSIQICGDYKVTVNCAAKVETYPLPKIDDLLASLGSGKVFTKLDLAHAYMQIFHWKKSPKSTLDD